MSVHYTTGAHLPESDTDLGVLVLACGGYGLSGTWPRRGRVERRHAMHPQRGRTAGIRTSAVHAEDERAYDFDAPVDFVPSLTDPRHPFLPIKDISTERERVGLPDRSQTPCPTPHFFSVPAQDETMAPLASHERDEPPPGIEQWMR